MVSFCFANVAEVSWLKIKKTPAFQKGGQNLAGKGVQTGAHGSLAGLHRAECWRNGWTLLCHRPPGCQECHRSRQAACMACGALFPRPARCH